MEYAFLLLLAIVGFYGSYQWGREVERLQRRDLSLDFIVDNATEEEAERIVHRVMAEIRTLHRLRGLR